MSNLKVAVRNRITATIEGATRYLLKNGGAGPALNQDADFPMANLLHPSRYTYWKCAHPSPGTYNVDYDCITSTTHRVAGVTRHRAHRGGSGITNVEIFTGTGSTYPPTWVSRGSFAMTPADSDKFLDFGSTTSRWLRFAITDGSQYSCKLWISRNSEVTDFGHEGGIVTEELRRIRSPERETYLGNRMFGELGFGAGAKQRRFRVGLPAASTAINSILQLSQGAPGTGTLLYFHHDGTQQECIHVGRDLIAEKLLSATTLADTDVYLESLP